MDHPADTTLPPVAAEATENPAEARRKIARTSQQGNELLTVGLSVGAIGLAGAALGAVCPLCVVATPALVGLGVTQKLRAAWMKRKTRG